MKYNKPVKVNSYYRGGSTHKIYLHKTKFQVLKELVVKRIKQIVRISLVAGAIYLIFLTGKSLGNETIINKVEAQDTLSGKIEDLKNEVVETIRKCESQGNNNLIYTFDPDPRQPSKQQASFGVYQYKLKTIVDYKKILHNETITERQALDIALDANQAKELTKDIVFKDTGKAVGNWYNCMNKHNLKEKVALIKSLVE